MNSFQYAIAKAAWEAFYKAKYEAQPGRNRFDELEAEKQRAWLAAAQAVLDTAGKYASGWSL